MASMTLFSPKALVTLACALSVSGLTIPSVRSDVGEKGPGFVKVDFSVTRTTTNSTDLQLRADNEIPIENEQSHYNIDIAFGSQKKVAGILIDTGSSDTWVQDSPSYYVASQSSTYQDANERFDITYGIGFARGEYVYDTVGIPNGPTLEHFQFGDVTQNGVPGGIVGILGIGYQGNEATVEYNEPQYTNFPAALKNAGYISKNAYSLYLNDVAATEGSVIFGGIDNEKYEGSLQTLPIQHPGSLLDVELDSVTTPDGNTHSAGTSVVLDSGTTLAYLPVPLVSAIAQSVGGILNPFGGIVTLPPGASTQGDVEFTFGGKQITVPFSNLASTSPLGGTLNIRSTIGQAVIGDVVLRSAYVVYDLDDNTIQIAQAKYTDASSIVPIN